MTTLTIQIEDEDTEVLLEVLKRFNARVVSTSKKDMLLAGIAQGLTEVKEMQQGKRKPLA